MCDTMAWLAGWLGEPGIGSWQLTHTQPREQAEPKAQLWAAWSMPASARRRGSSGLIKV